MSVQKESSSFCEWSKPSLCWSFGVIPGHHVWDDVYYFRQGSEHHKQQTLERQQSKWLSGQLLSLLDLLAGIYFTYPQPVHRTHWNKKRASSVSFSCTEKAVRFRLRCKNLSKGPESPNHTNITRWAWSDTANLYLKHPSQKQDLERLMQDFYAERYVFGTSET